MKSKYVAGARSNINNQGWKEGETYGVINKGQIFFKSWEIGGWNSLCLTVSHGVLDIFMTERNRRWLLLLISRSAREIWKYLDFIWLEDKPERTMTGNISRERWRTSTAGAEPSPPPSWPPSLSARRWSLLTSWPAHSTNNNKRKLVMISGYWRTTTWTANYVEWRSEWSPSLKYNIIHHINILLHISSLHLM